MNILGLCEAFEGGSFSIARSIAADNRARLASRQIGQHIARRDGALAAAEAKRSRNARARRLLAALERLDALDA